MLHSAVSGLGLYCLSVTHKKEARLIWVSKLQQSADYHNYSVFKFGYIYSIYIDMVLNLSVLKNRINSSFACGDFSTAVANSLDQDQD